MGYRDLLLVLEGPQLLEASREPLQDSAVEEARTSRSIQ
jgi:hypothetical protein